VIDRAVGAPLGWSTAEAAAAILDLATERMVGAIEDVTVSRGVDSGGRCPGGRGRFGRLQRRRHRAPTWLRPHRDPEHGRNPERGRRTFIGSHGRV
jgi:hypothetical protein